MRRRCCCGGGETPFTCACMTAVRPNPLYLTGQSTVTGNWFSITLAWTPSRLRWRYFSLEDGLWEIGCVNGALTLWCPGPTGDSSQAYPPGNLGIAYTCDPFSLHVDNATVPRLAPMMVTE